MTRAEWEARQVETGLSPMRAGEVADLIEYLSQTKNGREIEDWLCLSSLYGRVL